MDIDAMQEKTLINEFLREYTSSVTKSEPASWQDYSTGYHKENFEYERTRHTYHDTHEDIPAPGEKHHHSHHWLHTNPFIMRYNSNDQTPRVHHQDP